MLLPLLSMMLAPAALVAAPTVAPTNPTSPAIVAPADPRTYRETALAARAAFDKGDYATAEHLFRRAAKTYPQDGNNWRYLAAALRLQDKWAEAIPAYQQLIDRNGSFVGSGRYWQAVGQVKLGRTDAALATLRTMIETDHEIDRPGLAKDEQFKPLWADPRFIALVSPNPVAAGGDRVRGWRGDLDHLVAEIHRLTPDYRGRPLPPPTDRLVDRLRRDIPTLTDEQVYARMAAIVGSLHQGHTMMWGFSFDPGAAQRIPFSFLPVQPYAFPDGVYVVDAAPQHQALVGARIAAIGGLPIDRVMDAMRDTASFASEAEFAWGGPLRATIVPLLVGIGAAERAKPVTLTLDRGGKTSSVALDPVQSLPGKYLPRRGAAVGEEPFDLAPVGDGSTMLLRFDQVRDGKAETLAAFGRRAAVALADDKVMSAVVDLRRNNGGNSFLYPELVRALTAFSVRPGRQVYVLIGRGVYSAAGNFATDLERFANPVFIGEPTGNMGNQFGDEGAVLLPWSKLYATVAAVKWQLSHPWDTRGSIVPQVPVAQSAADYFAGRDPALDLALELAAKH